MMLHADFVSWAKDCGEKPLTIRQFSSDLDGIEGLQHKHRRNGKYFEGVRLRPEGMGSDGLASRGEQSRDWGDVPVTVPDWPGDPVDDPAEDWPRE